MAFDSSSTSEYSDADVDKMESDAFASTNQDRPMDNERDSVGSSTPGAGSEASTPSQAASVPQTEFTLNVRGEQIKVPYNDPRVNQWINQGRDYSQLMQKFNQQQAEWNKKQSYYQNLEETYKPIDEWATKNPQDWQRFQQSWTEQRNRPPEGIDPNSPLYQKLQANEEKLSSLEKFKQDFEQDKQFQKERKEDEALAHEIQSVTKQYSDLDWTKPGPNGKSLEYQVLEHAQQNGIKNFNLAFRDFYHEQLLKRAEEKGKEAVSQDLQKRNKLGLLGQTPTPTKGVEPTRDLKSKSYDDIHREILAEFNIR